MVNIFLCGHDGAMGGVVLRCAENQKDLKLSPFTKGQGSGCCDVLLDFSHPEMLASILNFSKKCKAPLVIATTGYSKEQEAQIVNASKEIPILRSANFSLAVYKFIRAVADFAKSWNGDIEVVETHHNKKADAPSGTAHVIANAILKARGGKGRIVLGRTPESGKRMPGDIGVTAVRGGTVAGLHEVRFYDEAAEVVMYEREYSKQSFALGAIEACRFMAKVTKPGIYNMDDLIK